MRFATLQRKADWHRAEGETGMAERNRITDIHCPNCGGPASFDIVRQEYRCGYCGGTVEIGEALRQKQGFRELQAGRLRESVKNFRLFQANCSGCGAEILFEEGEAMSNCPFCGRSLVRTDYLDAADMPESVIPFALTQRDAEAALRDWCGRNRRKREASELSGIVNELRGFYLPYEMIRGPVHMQVSRMDGFRKYRCEGFIRDEFVNRSSQLDNLLLDGMEPFDTEKLEEFDFAYVAGQRVKTADIPQADVASRAKAETETAYAPFVRKVLESRAVDVDADVSSAVRLPVLLPVYYICKGDLMAAVNGQTGKVSVRALRESHYYFLPWWLKAVFSTIAFTLICFFMFRAFGMETAQSAFISALLSAFFIIVTLCLYSDTARNDFAVESGREIYTSGEKTLVRERGQLVPRDSILMRKTEEPVFFEKLDGTEQPVVLRFTSPARVIRMALLCIVALFLPVIVALFINGFDFQRLSLGGSAVWFCIAVPVVPIYLLKFGIVELHDNPWTYTIKENGKLRRYRKKLNFHVTWDGIRAVLRVMFVPPASLAFWFGVISFIVMVYLTAGFE